MILPVVFHPAAEAEVADAYRWYEHRKAGLGEAFLAALERGQNRLHSTLESRPVVHGECVRRLVLLRFPYGIYYRILQNRVEVLSVRHSILKASALESEQVNCHEPAPTAHESAAGPPAG